MPTKEEKAALRRRAKDAIFSAKSPTKSLQKTPKKTNESSARTTTTPVRSPFDDIESYQRKLKRAEGRFYGREYAKSIGIKTPDLKKSSNTRCGNQPPIPVIASENSVASTLTNDTVNIKVDTLASLKAQVNEFYEELEAIVMDANQDDNIAIDSDLLKDFNAQAEDILNSVTGLISEDDSTI